MHKRGQNDKRGSERARILYKEKKKRRDSQTLDEEKSVREEHWRRHLKRAGTKILETDILKEVIWEKIIEEEWRKDELEKRRTSVYITWSSDPMSVSALVSTPGMDSRQCINRAGVYEAARGGLSHNNSKTIPAVAVRSHYTHIVTDRETCANTYKHTHNMH